MRATSTGDSTMGRSILAIVIGYVVMLMCLGISYAVALALFPSMIPKPSANAALSGSILGVATVLGFAYGLLGAWATNLVARRPGAGHGLALAAVIVILGSVKPIVAPGKEALRSHLILLIGCVAGAIVGAFLTAPRDKAVRLPQE